MAVRDQRAIWSAETFGQDLVEVTVGDLLDRQAETFPDKEALVYRYPEIGLNLRLSYRALRDAANRLAKGLIALGVEPGNKVAVLATNVPEWVLLEMALPKIGAVLVTVNVNCQKAELDYLLQQAEVHTLILQRENRGNNHLRSLRSLMPELQEISDPSAQAVSCASFPHFRHAVLLDGSGEAGLLPFARMVTLGERVSDHGLAARQAAVKPHDISQIQFTSGTTGSPKGAMITHHGTINNARFVALRARLGFDDRYVTAMPLFHTAGNVVDQLSMLVCGGTVIKAITFDPVKMLELIDRENATVIDAVPTMLIALLQEPRFSSREFDTSSLRVAITGGTPVPVPLMEEVKKRLGAEPVIVFGMTEASPIVTQTLPDDGFELRSSTVGVPLPHTEVKIVAGSGETAAVGEPGEILIRGYCVTKGYYNMPAQTAQAIDAEGWLHSGDLGSMDANGYVRIVGRIKDMIIRGGENFYPAELEAFLMRHPKVQQGQVVGVPDPYMGEEAVAVLQLKQGESMTETEVRDWCRANLARNKVPRYVRFVTEFPQTSSGKVKKFELRAKLIEDLGIAASGN